VAFGAGDRDDVSEHGRTCVGPRDLRGVDHLWERLWNCARRGARGQL
jgi:hypothetical protein